MTKRRIRMEGRGRTEGLEEEVIFSSYYDLKNAHALSILSH
jgi:hypothetical protein